MAQQGSPTASQNTEKKLPISVEPSDEAQLESMVQSTGTLDLDDNGNWDYHGVSSGWTFLRRLRAQMGPSFSDPRHWKKPKLPAMLESQSPRSPSESPLDGQSPVTHDLPPIETARKLCRNALDDACALMRFIHQPTFYQRMDKIYSTDPERFTNTDSKFLPVLYLVMAVGCMFSTAEDDRLDVEGYEKGIGQGYDIFPPIQESHLISEEVSVFQGWSATGRYYRLSGSAWPSNDMFDDCFPASFG